MERAGEQGNSGADYAAMANAICQAVTVRGKGDAALLECAHLASTFGFDGFSYIVVRPGTVGVDLVSHWTTASGRWKSQYRAHAYHAVDPRVTLTSGRSIPIAWQEPEACTDPRRQAFRIAARTHFIRSGVAMSVQEERGHRAIVTWDSRVVRSSAARAPSQQNELATLALLGGFLHERMRTLAPPQRAEAAPHTLSPRERDCLTLAARGMTSADIGVKLGIAERTANFHIGNLVTKLGALNRGEAIARGVALNLVAVGR